MPLQNHIHLSTTLQSSGEKAPDLKWAVTDRLEIPVKFMALKRSLTGALRKHLLVDLNGAVHLTHFKYTVKVQNDYSYTLEQRISQLRAMDGQNVYLCDSFHVADGQDHTALVRAMVLSIGEFPPVGPGLPFFLVDVELEDASR